MNLRARPFTIPVFLMVLFLMLIILVGCGGFPGSGGSYKSEAMAAPRDGDYGMDRTEGAGMELEMAEEEPAPVGTSVAQPQEFSTTSTGSEPKQVERKRVFSGAASLVVDDPEDTKEKISSLAENSGGYVESAYADSIVIRVPAEMFDQIFGQILDMGDVDFKSIETADVTDYFFDMQSRLDLNTKTRERLYDLLERTEDVEERVKILREIKRLTEEIERIRRTLELLKSRISLSRISIQLTPRLPVGEETRRTIPFPWVGNLNPLYESLGYVKDLNPPDLGDDFAVFAEENRFSAESPEGTRLRIGAARNEPRGDDAFWQEALRYHLGPLYSSAETLSVGDFKGILFVSKDADPFIYFVGVRTDPKNKADGEIKVLEIFFPDIAAKDRRLVTIINALEEGAQQGEI